MKDEAITSTYREWGNLWSWWRVLNQDEISWMKNTWDEAAWKYRADNKITW
jgi:hypothetical protein